VWTNVDYSFIVSDVLEDFSVSEVGTKRRLKKSTTMPCMPVCHESHLHGLPFPVIVSIGRSSCAFSLGHPT